MGAVLRVILAERAAPRRGAVARRRWGMGTRAGAVEAGVGSTPPLPPLSPIVSAPGVQLRRGLTSERGAAGLGSFSVGV